MSLPQPHWPCGKWGFIAVAALSGMFAVTFMAVHSDPNLTPLASLYKSSLALVGSQSAIRVIAVSAWLAHFAEAVYAVVHVCKGRGTAHQAIGWFILVGLTGYPSLQELLAESATKGRCGAGSAGKARTSGGRRAKPE